MRLLVLGFAALVVATGCGTGTRVARDAAPPRSNEKVLTHAQSDRLVRWAGEFRSCLRRRGYDIGGVELARTRIELAVPSGTAFRPLLHDGIACGDSLGGPPPASSLQTFSSRIVLYLPKRCLLDPNVTATVA
jgi:hypothetical protein